MTRGRGRRRQRGMFLPALLELGALGAVGWLLSHQTSAASRQLRQDMQTAHALAVDPRQAEVENGGGVGLVQKLALGGHAVTHPVDLEAQGPQAGTQTVAEQLIVFGKQQSHDVEDFSVDRPRS